MKIPVIKGVIARRILINYRVDPDVLACLLPPPFRPKIVDGVGIAGVCLIRLEAIRPWFLPARLGLRSENAAHRIAVVWDTPDGPREGVYIPRRDTNSRINTLVGGRLFPGTHQHARFTVAESGNCYRVILDSDDGQTHVRVAAQVADRLPATSIFPTVADVSAFFEQGSLGYSPTNDGSRFEGLELRTRRWQMKPLAVALVESSFFADHGRFPAGSAAFDCALLMRGIPHEWHGRGELCPADAAPGGAGLQVTSTAEVLAAP